MDISNLVKGILSDYAGKEFTLSDLREATQRITVAVCMVPPPDRKAEEAAPVKEPASPSTAPVEVEGKHGKKAIVSVPDQPRKPGRVKAIVSMPDPPYDPSKGPDEQADTGPIELRARPGT